MLASGTGADVPEGAGANVVYVQQEGKVSGGSGAGLIASRRRDAGAGWGRGWSAGGKSSEREKLAVIKTVLLTDCMQHQSVCEPDSRVLPCTDCQPSNQQ